MKNYVLHAAFLLILPALAWAEPRSIASLESPAKVLRVELTLDDGRPGYRVQRLGEPVIGNSRLGFLLREGGKVSLFGGNADGMDFTQPRQVLRSGGNVITTFLQDENEDGEW